MSAEEARTEVVRPLAPVGLGLKVENYCNVLTARTTSTTPVRCSAQLTSPPFQGGELVVLAHHYQRQRNDELAVLLPYLQRLIGEEGVAGA